MNSFPFELGLLLMLVVAILGFAASRMRPATPSIFWGLLPKHCAPALLGVTTQVDADVVLTIHTSGVDLNGAQVDETHLDPLLADVYRTRATRTLFITADDGVLYARLISSIVRLKSQSRQLVLLSKKSQTELLRHGRALDCYYAF